MSAYEEVAGIPAGLIRRGIAPTVERCGLEECGCCYADVGVSAGWLWHLPDDDCRAIREPVSDEEYERVREIEVAAIREGAA